MSHETPFDIRLAPDASYVEVWSDAPPAFEPRDWKKALRAGIRDAVQHIRCSRDQMLDAYYCFRGRDNADTENVLFYNIGASNFRTAASSAIRFTRVFAHPPLTPGKRRRPVYLRYDIAPLEAPSRVWELQTEPLARWQRVLLVLPSRSWGPSSGTQAGLYWLSMKRARPQLGESPCHGRFALDLTLHGPSAVNLTSVVKALVDGVVASFQAHRGPVADDALSKLKHQLGSSAPDDDTLRAWLRDPELAVLGARDNLAMPRGPALWNPRDLDCVLCRLRFEPEHDGQWFLSGVLNAVVRARVP